MQKLSIEDAKHRLRVPSLWTHFGFQGHPKTSCRCPWREDHKPSFSVSPDGLLWHDFATDEGGDAIDFLARASGLSRAAACRKFLELAGVRFTSEVAPPATRQKPRPNFPRFERGSAADFEQLANIRNLSTEGLQLASERGLLWFSAMRNFRAWVVTDTERVNAQAKRMDGSGWEHLDGKPKAWTLPGSWAGWPIGAKEALPFPTIAFVEGAPDLLAAFHFIWCENREAACAPVAMLGASQRIHENALPVFAGKRIRIFGHDDAEGCAAVNRWAHQLRSTDADLDAFNFAGLRKVDGSRVKDLNDFALIHAEDFEANGELWRIMP